MRGYKIGHPNHVIANCIKETNDFNLYIIYLLKLVD